MKFSEYLLNIRLLYYKKNLIMLLRLFHIFKSETINEYFIINLIFANTIHIKNGIFRKLYVNA